MTNHDSPGEAAGTDERSHPLRPGWILSDITKSLRPPRLLLGLLAACLLLIGGRGWDLLTPASAGPALTVSASEQAEQRLLAMLSYYRVDGPAPESVSAELVLEAMRSAWKDGEAADDPDRFERDWAEASALAPRHTFAALTERLVMTAGVFSQTLFAGRPDQAVLAAGRLMIELPGLLWSLHPIFTLVFGVWCLAVFGIIGSAIARIAACDRAGLERPTPRAALIFAFRRAGATIGALALPITLVAGLMVLAGTAGLLFAVPGLNVVAGVFYPLFLLAGALIAFLAVGLVLGGGLFVPAVASESCDAIDAVQRSFGYALNRPAFLAAYGATALLAFAIGWIVVAGFVGLTLDTTAASAGLFGSPPALDSAGGGALFGRSAEFELSTAAGSSDRFTAGVVHFWQGLAGLIVVGWIISWFFSTGTTIYLLMRQACDGQRPTDVWHDGLAPGTLAELPATA